ncbi:formate-dependent phosphoribosylglycinamide formyltransferase [Solimonas flava]|uniref:formate-dependent phosphoribosylglycinamide formyltransferase n=1 Tax=Solimonas flava TaxID=415849 RepID=UPI00040FBAAF|nr:formate-dependent phosphoribosylglycinamide formyltransferase [Solimonas flava]
MTVFGTPLSGNATKVLMLGSGELGKEVVIELQRYGVETIAVDRYANAPAMQVAHRSHVINMLDGAEVRRVIELERPDLIVPEIEAIHTPTLLALEQEGYTVIPTARAARLTMDREGIRRLAAEELGLPTSPYRFAGSIEEYRAAVDALGLPCVVKPVMSSSGKGQSVVRSAADVQHAWDYAQAGGRAGQGRVIVEGFVPFDYEITLLTVKHAGGISFCPPIGHLQIDGDYRESWQPQPMSEAVLRQSQDIAAKVVEALCAPNGRGLFGVELFVRGGEAIFSEVSPRPHDTGLVTLISQDLSEFALHARAILGLPIPNIRTRGAAASCAVLFEGDRRAPRYAGAAEALAEPDTQLRLFGKPEIVGKRRMAVTLALAESIDMARDKARRAAAQLRLID